MSPPIYRTDGTLTGYADRIASVFAQAVLSGERDRAQSVAGAAPDLIDLFADIVKDRDLAIYMAQAPLTKSLGHAGALPVIAIGPQGGKIVGYQGGDLKKPIYAGTAAAQALASEKGEEDAGAHGLAEMLSSLVDHFGLNVTPGSKMGETYQSTVQGGTTALAAAMSTYDGAGVSWVPVSETEFKLVLNPAAGLAPADYAASTVKQKGGPPPPGWPENHPGPGAVFVKTVEGWTYTLEIVAEGSKPAYVVTSPGPLFLFAGGAYGAVQGQVGDGPPVAVKFASASAAAIACLGPKEKGGKWIKKSTNGHWWWGWKGKTKKKAPDIPPEEHTGEIAAPGLADMSSVIDSATALAGEAGVLWVDGLPPAPESEPEPEPEEAEAEPLPDWSLPHPPGSVASKVVPNVKNGPKNAGKAAVLVLLPNGEMQATWPEGGAVYDKKGNELAEAPPGYSETFGSPTAAAQAFTGTPTNGHKWWFKLGDVQEPGDDNFETMPEPEPEPVPPGHLLPGPQAVMAWMKVMPTYDPQHGDPWVKAMDLWLAAAPDGAELDPDGIALEILKTPAGWKNLKTGYVYTDGIPYGAMKVVGAGKFVADFVQPEPPAPAAGVGEWIEQKPDSLDTKAAVTKWLQAAPEGATWDSAPGSEDGAVYTKVAGMWGKTLKGGSVATPYPSSAVAVFFMTQDALTGGNASAGLSPPPPPPPLGADAWVSAAPGSFTAEWLAMAPVGTKIDLSVYSKGVYRKTPKGWLIGDAVVDAGKIAASTAGLNVVAEVPAELFEDIADWYDQKPDDTGVMGDLPPEWESWLQDAPPGIVMGPIVKTGSGWEWTEPKDGEPESMLPVAASGYIPFMIGVHPYGMTSLDMDESQLVEWEAAVDGEEGEPPAQPLPTPSATSTAAPTGWPAWAPPPGTEYEHNGWTVEVIDHFGHPGFMVEGEHHALHLDDLALVAQHIEASDSSPPGSVLPTLAAGLGVSWPPPGFSSFSAVKTLKVAKKAPANVGKSFKIEESAAGYTVTWLEGGKDYTTGVDVEAGGSSDFGSLTAAAKAVANAAVNASVWWGAKPNPKGEIVSGVKLNPQAKLGAPAASADDVFGHLFDVEVNWDEWESDTESEPGEWLEYAPDGAVVHAGQDNYWKSKGVWHSASGQPVAYDEILAALDQEGSRSIQGLGPDGKVYPKGTTFAWVTIEHTLAGELGPALSDAVLGATYFPNPKNPAVTTIKLPSSGLTGEEAAAKIAPVLDKLGIGYDPDKLVKHVGGSYIYLAIPAVQDDVVISTETVVVPTLPSFQGSSNNTLLDSPPLPEHSLLGLAIDADSDKIADQHVKQRALPGGGREIVFKLTPWARKKANATLASMPVGAMKYGAGVWDGSTAPAISKTHYTVPGRKVEGAGWTADLAGPKYWTFEGTVRLEVAPGNDPRAALDQFGAKAGIGPLSHAPSDADVERLKALKVLYSVDPKAHDKLLAAGEMPDIALVEKALAKHGVNAQGAVYVQPTPSHRTLSLQDGEKIRASGLAGVRHNWGGTAAQLAAALAQGGLMATEVRMRTGIAGTGISSAQDVNTGGAAALFTHPVYTGNGPTQDGMGGGKAYTVFFGTKTLERVDWFAATGDAFGSTKPSSGYYKSRPARYAAGKQPYLGEIVFRHGLGTDEVAGIKCSTQASRSKLLKALKADGITTLGGVPVEDALVVDVAQGLKRIEDDWQQTLKERT